MSQQFESCPQCASGDITTNRYQVRCRGCGWSLQDPDPRYVAHVEELGWENLTLNEPIAEAIDALPADFAESLTTTRSALPAGHPVNKDPLDSMTGAEFRNTRESFGLSAEWLADRMGVALKTIQRWENGHRPIPQGVANEMGIIATAVREGAARKCAEQLLKTPGAVMMIPRTGTHLGFPASWYRALVESVHEVLVNEYGDRGLTAAAFRLVYFDEVEGQS
jgi:DNA-binding XRE family transcriptional regulator